MDSLRIRAGLRPRPPLFGAVVAIALSALAAGCSTTTGGLPVMAAPNLDPPKVMYAASEDGDFKVAAINLKRTKPQYLRQVVATPGSIASGPGTIVVDPHNRFLYLVLAGGKSMRYGIGVGRQGFAWSGSAEVKMKREWPRWQPPDEMIARDPRLKGVADGMDGGPRNPLGARALYLFANGVDTFYRIHGTSEPSSIGKAVSSGCIRMFNQDIIDLYDRVGIGARVVVLPAGNESITLPGVAVTAPASAVSPRA